MAFSIGEISANVGADTSSFSASINQVHKQGERVSSDIAQQFNRVGDAFVSAGKKLTTRVTAPLLALAGLSVKAFDTQIQAEKRLEAALRSAGEEVQNNLKDFKEFARGLQEITTVGDESTLQMIQVAKSMGLTNEQSKRAAKNSIALAKAMGMNEQSAIRYAAALEQGQVTMLSRYLPGLRDIEDMSERAAKAQELLSDMFSAATAEAENGLGPLRQIRNTLGDFSEEIGEIVMKRMQPLIDDLRGTVNWFKNLDQGSKELIVTVGGLAAAIGPATLGLGWAIKLTIPAIQAVTTAVKGLTAVMIANPYLAVGAAIAAIAVAGWRANKAIKAFNDSVDAILAGQAKSWQEVNDMIVKVSERMDEIRQGAAAAGLDPRQNEEFVRLNEQLERLIALRDKFASQELVSKVANDRLADTQALIDFINTDLSKLSGQASALNISRPFVEAKEPVHELIQALDMIPQKFQELTADQILADEGNITFEDKLFPPGSLGAMQERLTALKESLREAVDPETIARLKEEIGLTTEQINNLTGSAQEAAGAGQIFGQALGQAMSQAVLHAKRFDDVLKNILKQLASQALMQFVTAIITGGSSLAAGSIGKALFGGLFHSGGVVPGSGEKLVLAKGGEGIFTPRQMAAMGNMNGGGGMSKGDMQQAFEGALGNMLSKLGPEEIYTLSKRGQFSY